MSLLTVDNLSLSFGRHSSTEVVKNISFDINAGERLALVGESGSGKSVTAMSILQLHDVATSRYGANSSVRWQDRELIGIPENQLRAIRGNEIAMIFQEPMSALNPLHTIGQQIGESIDLHQPMNASKKLATILELLDRVGIANPQQRVNSYPHQLSGGQRQRAMIAMALACQPRLLIADEPTTALDVTIQQQILELLLAIQKQDGMAILLITHDLNLVRKYTQRVCVMCKGEIVEQGTVESIFTNAQHPYTQQLLRSEPQLLIDRSETATLAQQPALLQAENIVIHFPVRRGLLQRQVDAIKAVDGVSMQIYPSETVGIVGESGSGKTTFALRLLRLLAGEGAIQFENMRWDSIAEKQLRKLRNRLQIVFQDPFSALSPRLTVEQTIGEGLGIFSPHLSAEQQRRRIVETLLEVGLEAEHIDRYPHEFSGGQRQRIAIARAVILQPKLIVLDEPTSALDISVQKQILQLLRSLQQKHGMSYLFISHDLAVIRAIAHRVMVMRNGVVVESGDTATIFDNPQHPYTKTLLQAALGKQSA